jgi:acetolactate synthase-1/2/3 large subunit
MADGYARAKGSVGFCCSIGAPGAANMIPAALTAAADRSPVLYLTGNPSATLTGAGAFQDGGGKRGKDRALFRAAIGFSEELADTGEVQAVWERIASRLLGQPPGPAHLMARYDVLARPAAPFLPGVPLRRRMSHRHAMRANDLKSQRTLRVLLNAPRVVVLAGRELGAHPDTDALIRLAETYSLPVATTAEAKGVFPENHPLHLGVFGYGGSPRAAAALLDESVDMILVLGAELNERNTMCWDERFFASGRKIVQVRLPAGSRDRTRFRRKIDFIWQEPVSFLRDILADEDVPSSVIRERSRWLSELRSEPGIPQPPPDLHVEKGGMHPAKLIMVMREVLPSGTTLFLDSGMHRFYANHYWTMTGSDRLFTAANLAPTGWAIAAGIGAGLATRHSRITVLSGDVCLLMHGTELAVAARYNVPVTFVISNNGGSGNIYRRMQSSPEALEMARLPRIDCVGFARSLGVRAVSARTAPELREALRKQAELPGPFLIDASTRIDVEPPKPHYSFSSCSAAMLERIANDGCLFAGRARHRA